MPAKITLTGKRTSKLRKTPNYISFDMEEAGSPTAPKGLPIASSVQYTVFVSIKQAKKINLENVSQDTKLLVQGEISLDIPVQNCPGEIGVIVFQIGVIEPKEKTTDIEK